MIGRFLRARRASIAVYAGVMLPALAGMAGLGGEYAYGLMTKSSNQRIADAAAYAGAQVYNTTASSTSMTAAVSRIATMNGVASTAAVPALVASPTGSGNQAVQVTVTTTQTLVLSRLVSSNQTLTISATAYAELSSSTPACMLALSSIGTGVTLSGGTHLNAPGCAVASNNTVTVPCGTYIVTPSIKYNSTAAPSVGCGGITAPTGKTLTTTKAATADWLAGNATVAQATTNYASVAAMTAPTGPTVATKAGITFAYATNKAANPNNAIPSQAPGCTASLASPVWTVTCAAGGNYSFGPIDLQGGITVNWAVSGSATNTYSFSGPVQNTGSAMSFGPGIYNMAGGLYTGGGSSTTFGSGTYSIGRYATTCNSDTYSICHTGTTLTFTGPVAMTLSNGITGGGGTTTSIGANSSANSYSFGGGQTNHTAIDISGGGKLTLGDATATGKVFNVVGKVSSSGGSCVTLPAAAAHNINGSVTSAGGLVLGAGVYTINGYFALGENNGGAVSCNNVSVGLLASAVSLQVSGTALATGSCNGYAFCVAAGFTNVTLVAPSTGSDNAGFAVIGPTSSANTGGALFTQGASGVSLSGVFYVPYGPVALSGGSSVGNGTGQCLELVGKQITLSGGTALASTCTGLGGGGTNTVMLVK